jgi:outer membrane protein OmpA-like peptidoglycan-associated protein
MDASKDHDKKHDEHGGHGGGGGQHGGGGHEEHEGAPEWLISFADNVTLMMGFFVIMLAMAMGPKGGGENKDGDGKGGSEPSISYLDTSVAIREAFNNPVDLNSQDPNEQVLVRHVLWRRGLGTTDQVGPEGSEHDVQSLRPSKYYSLCGLIPFAHDNARLSESAVKSLDSVITHVQGRRFIIDVRGHVSAQEAFGEADHSTRLGFERALAVAQALVERGLDWRQLRVVSCADSDRAQPIAYDEPGHQKNRRVEIIVTDHVMPDATQTEISPDRH